MEQKWLQWSLKNSSDGNGSADICKVSEEEREEILDTLMGSRKQQQRTVLQCISSLPHSDSQQKEALEFIEDFVEASVDDSLWIAKLPEFSSIILHTVFFEKCEFLKSRLWVVLAKMTQNNELVQLYLLNYPGFTVQLQSCLQNEKSAVVYAKLLWFFRAFVGEKREIYNLFNISLIEKRISDEFINDEAVQKSASNMIHSFLPFQE